VYVPRHTDLTLSTENGPLSIEDVIGTMDLSTENGPLALTAVGGAVRRACRTGRWPCVLEGAKWDGTGLERAETITGRGPRDPRGLLRPARDGHGERALRVGFPMTVTVQGRISQHLSTVLGRAGRWCTWRRPTDR